MNEPVLFIVKSADRTSGTSSNFVWHNKEMSQMLFNIRELELMSVHIPNTIYNIRTGVNNTFTINRGTNTVTLSAGMYTIDTLVSAVQTALGVTDGATTWTVTYSSTTGRVTIAGTNAFTITWGTTSPKQALGFSTDTTSNTTVTGDQSYTLVHPYEIYITILEFGRPIRTTNARDFPTFVVDVLQPTNNVIIYVADQNTPQKIIFSPLKTIDQLTVRLSMYGNESVDLNGSEWAMVFKAHPYKQS